MYYLGFTDSTMGILLPYRNTLDLQPTCSDQPTFNLHRSCVQFRMFLYGHIETHSGRISQIPAHTLTMHSAVRLYRFQNVFLYGKLIAGRTRTCTWAFISTGPITGLCLPFHHREFSGVMTSEYGEGNYSLTHHIETHFSVIPRPERWLGLRRANVFLYGFTDFYRT